MTPFDAFVARKTQEAARAAIPPLRTLAAHDDARTVGVGNEWTRERFDGDFYLFDPPPALPAISLVFVQSRDGNTGADHPDTLGGGATDRHLIYEGLSRVAADAVLAGAATAVGPNMFFSVWHPEIVALRRSLGLPRHPAQIVLSRDGHLDFDDTLLFNVSEVRVFILAAAECDERCARALEVRPWITVLRTEPLGITDALSRLRHTYRLTRISVVGGRTTASRLIDAGLVQDLCLTTTTREGGQANTPFYTGERRLRFEAILKKRGTDDEAPILFEHLALREERPREECINERIWGSTRT